MNKLPAIQFYPADWRKDPGVQSLSYHDRGVWFEIICLMHESEQRGKLLLNGKAMPEDALARLLGLDKQIATKTISTLLEYGVASQDQQTGALMCRRMIRDEELRKVRQDAGKMGGNPALVKQKPTTGDKQKPTPSSSPSTSTSFTAKEGGAREGTPIRDALEEILPGLVVDFQAGDKATKWATEFRATPDQIRAFPGWLERNHPKTALTHWAFRDHFHQSLKGDLKTTGNGRAPESPSDRQRKIQEGLAHLAKQEALRATK